MRSNFCFFLMILLTSCWMGLSENEMERNNEIDNKIDNEIDNNP